MIDLKKAVLIAKQGALDVLGQAPYNLEEIERIRTRGATSGASHSACRARREIPVCSAASECRTWAWICCNTSVSWSMWKRASWSP